MNVVPTKTELIDLFWRSLWTFIATFITAFESFDLLTKMFPGQVVINLSPIQSAAAYAVVAAFAAVGTLVKVYSSNKLGSGTATTRIAPVGALPQPVASNFATPAQ